MTQHAYWEFYDDMIVSAKATLALISALPLPLTHSMKVILLCGGDENHQVLYFKYDYLAWCEFGHSFGAFWDCMLGKLSWEDEPDCSLDLARRDSWLLVVPSKLCSLCCNLLKDVVDEGVQNGHSLGTDACVWVHLQRLMILLTIAEPKDCFKKLFRRSSRRLLWSVTVRLKVSIFTGIDISGGVQQVQRTARTMSSKCFAESKHLSWSRSCTRPQTVRRSTEVKSRRLGVPASEPCRCRFCKTLQPWPSSCWHLLWPSWQLSSLPALLLREPLQPSQQL